ncbi:WD40 repeat domain-containing protein [Nannocystis punicea]|uniref:Anaphase-promoting complex subunit 4 WD40 domain-containing protein n=1 Tax=Nannocystis punicea TaxID=2995304 RepID=A0ABY7HHZ1_9BACT|nr:hypothetical protein [Nannocystis poenicansa]WAS98675.1 hypothetical protein O0S08_21285 [Nannocystis poenicansa]
MEPRLKSPPSKLAKLKPAIAALLPGGLPADVARFYAKSDGLKFSLQGEEAVLVGLAEMFGGLKKGAFRGHVVVKKADLDELEWSDLPFYERFFNEYADVFDKKSLDRLNLRMRLKLLVSVAGESTELGIDYFDAKPTIYFVHRADAAYPLKDLGFDDFVEWFAKFGTRRWYFAFLDKKAEASLNIDLRAELERSLEDFPPEAWAPLLARLPKKKEPGPVRAQVLAAASDRPVVLTSFPPLKQPPEVLDEEHPRGVAFSADGQHLVVWGANHEVVVHDVGRRERLWKQKHAEAMDLSADGQTVAVLEHPRASERADRLVLRACATGKPLHREPWRPGCALKTLACVGGGRVVVADTADTLHVLDVATQRTLKTVPRVKHVRRLGAAGDTARVLAHIQAYDEGAMALTGPSAVKLLDLATGAVVTSWAGATTFAASADGALVALGSSGKRSVVRIVELESGRVVHELQGGATNPDEDPHAGFHLAFSPDGARLVVSERVYDASSKTVTSTVSLYDAKLGTLVERVDLGRNPERPRLTIDAEGLALSADGVLCVAADAYGLRLWRV